MRRQNLVSRIAPAIVFAFMLAMRATPAAAAAVSWNFIETSIVSNGQPVAGVPLPSVAASLSVSDQDFRKGGISYTYYNDRIGRHYTITGDTDFTFSGPILFPVSPDPFVFDASLNLTFNSTGQLSGSMTQDSLDDNLQMSITNDVVEMAAIATDGSSFGCPDSQCYMNGYWELASALPVPEPRSIILLAIALGSVGLLARVVGYPARP